LGRGSARELLVADEEANSAWVQQLLTLLSRRPAIATLEAHSFSGNRASALLKTHLSAASLEGFGLHDAPLAAGAGGGALRYLKDTQRTDASHVDRIRRTFPGHQLRLDEASLYNLEVLRTLKDGNRKGALIGVLDRTCTGMGARKLARWLSAPLTVIAEI